MSEHDGRLAQLSAEERALLFEKLRRRKEQGGHGGGDAHRIPPRPEPWRSGPAPLSFSQQRLWFLDRLSPGLANYNIGTALTVHGALDPQVLCGCLQTVVDRHEVLRTTFEVTAGVPAQIVRPHREVALPVIDLTPAGSSAPPEALGVCAVLQDLPFDLAAGPLLRATLLRLGPEEHILVLSMHHIVSDGWSLNLLMDELVALSRGEPLAPLPIQYADYAVWQREPVNVAHLEEGVALWRPHLQDLPEAIALPTDRPRPPVKSPAGAAAAFPLTAEHGARLPAPAREEGVTLFMLLLAAAQILLARWSGQERFAVGTVAANRGRRELEPLIGFFANTLALAADLRGAPTVRELLARVRETTLAAFAHQDVPFEKLVEALHPVRDPSRPPIYQVSLSLQNTPPPHTGFGELGLSGLSIPARFVKFDLEAAFDQTRDGTLQGTLLYSTALWDAATAARLTGHFAVLLAALAEHRDTAWTDLPLLTPAEHAQLAAWNTAVTAAPGPAPEERFAALAAAAPEAPAVVSAAGEVVTRGDLDAAADRLARRLRRLGVGPEVAVGVVLPRSPELVCAALAVARAGGVYVPLDPAYPPERIETALGDAGARVVLTVSAVEVPLRRVGRAVVVLDAKDDKEKDDKEKDDKDGKDNRGKDDKVDGDLLAYVIYTSGSTGVPKGVGLCRGGLARLVSFSLRAFGVQGGDRATLMAGPAFDGSVWELWHFLCGGAAIHLPDEETRLSPARLASWMARERITVTFLPTPLAEGLLAEPAAAALPLRFLAVAGDRLHRIARHDLPFPVWNLYGPSEATVMTSCSLDDAAADLRDPSVGRPIDGARVWVLDPSLHPQPVGVPGELWVGGPLLGRGYLGRPDWTAAAWRPDPFSTVPGERLYRTGDLARFRPDGNLDVLGRLDGQVKVRGFRVETGEVESVLADHPAVQQAVVLPRAGLTLVAFVVAGAVGDAELRAHLRRRVPEYMVPALFVRLAALPLSPGGKVDRAALEHQAAWLTVPGATPGAAPGAAPPRSATEKAVAALWAELLDRAVPGVDESFFDLGGHSLLLARLQARIHRELGREVPLLALIEHPTIAGFAAWLDGETESPLPDAGASRDRAERQRLALAAQRQRLARRPPT